ncbi:ankyrin repeat-containing domain protein [Jimgerdemannia flammicorona]|uniref:Ankyrin repeat-containing domain protein n=1 Tax=Jimgerdemannia flammicorona TaxID=994334 RepID=A0A433A1C1_9FUNG|nr:ankyrin repeat-containing domain protein [Jimgerdemannia flammicorona]
MLYQTLHDAILKGDFKIVSMLACEETVNYTDSDGRTAIHIASIKGHIKILQMLIERRANTFEMDGNNNTPLHVAVLNGNVAIVELLLKIPHLPIKAKNK